MHRERTQREPLYESEDEDSPIGARDSSSITFYFDFASPYAYLAAMKIDEIARLYDRSVDWRPTLLGIVFRATGNQPMLDQPVKSDYARRDLDRCARALGLPLVLPESMPFSSVAAARATYWLKDFDKALARDVARALFTAAFGEGRDIQAAETVCEIAAAMGADGAALATALEEASVKDRLRTEVDASIAAGVCGAPFIIVDGEPFWGADRLDHVERWLATGGW